MAVTVIVLGVCFDSTSNIERDRTEFGDDFLCEMHEIGWLYIFWVLFVIHLQFIAQDRRKHHSNRLHCLPFPIHWLYANIFHLSINFSVISLCWISVGGSIPVYWIFAFIGFFFHFFCHSKYTTQKHSYTHHQILSQNYTNFYSIFFEQKRFFIFLLVAMRFRLYSLKNCLVLLIALKSATRQDFENSVFRFRKVLWRWRRRQRQRRWRFKRTRRRYNQSKITFSRAYTTRHVIWSKKKREEKKNKLLLFFSQDGRKI